MCKAFWFTHYISFCAIATLYVYTIQQSLPRSQSADGLDDDTNISTQQSTHQRRLVPNIQHFEAAEKCQRSIAETTAKTSPFRRYNIILDELKSEVLHCLGRISVTDSTIVQPRQEAESRSRNSMDSSGRTAFGTSTPSGAYQLDVGVLQDSSFQLQPNVYAPAVPTFDFRSSHDPTRQHYGDSVLDLDLFGSQGEFIGWSEFDSCVSADWISSESVKTLTLTKYRPSPGQMGLECMIRDLTCNSCGMPCNTEILNLSPENHQVV